MTRLRYAVLILFICLPLTANAAVSSDDFPADTMWYMHADLKAMSTSESGRDLYLWLDDEVFEEIGEELGIDLKEVDRITAFSYSTHGVIIVIDGEISQSTREIFLAVALLEGDLDTLTYGKATYYHVGDGHSTSNDDDFEALEDSAYFTFAIEDKLIVASDEEQLKALIDRNGKIVGAGKHDKTLFVLTAEKEFVQAGMHTKGFAKSGIDWDSNILRNIEQVALLVADHDGMIAIEANLVTSEPRMAASVASIIGGLISLKVFSDELDPDISRILDNTKVEVNDRILSISTIVDPQIIVNVIDQ